jgi:hypothetical protein
LIDSYCTIDCAKKKDRLCNDGSPEEAGRLTGIASPRSNQEQPAANWPVVIVCMSDF